MEWVVNTSVKGLISTIYKELIKLNTPPKKKPQLKTGKEPE